MKNILDYTKDYIKIITEERGDEFKTSKVFFTCPNCFDPNPSCGFIAERQYNMACGKCHFSGEITDLISPNREEALQIIRDKLKLPLLTGKELEELLSFYKENNFDLVPIIRGGKAPIEKDWTNKNHTNIEEWKIWLDRNSNIGVKTGKVSNITVVDLDDMNIPEEVISLFDPNTCIQLTNKGKHYFYQYEPDLPKTRIEKYKIDIENDGGQVVIAPSTIDGVLRIVTKEKITKMPKELKEFLLKNCGTNGTKKALDNQNSLPDINLAEIPDGQRHHILMRLGGTLRKELNASQLEYVLSVLNQLACKPKLDKKEFRDILSSLTKYDDFDEKDLAKTILRYIEIVEECGWRDIKEALGFPKEKIDKVLKYLEKEGYLIKKQRLYHLIKRAEWHDTWLQETDEVKIHIPYLHDAAIVRDGDLILIGGKSGTGKTHIAMNMIKLLVEQGVTPYYISLESGSRFGKIAQELGLGEGQFKWAKHFSPESIELEPNAITVLDWLLPRDYASTDKTYEHFAKQLVKQGGVLIVFCQLRRDGSFFAEDMIKFFPAVVAKFLYDDDGKGATSKFEVVKMRESKTPNQYVTIALKYDWKEKKLTRIEGKDI